MVIRYRIKSRKLSLGSCSTGDVHFAKRCLLNVKRKRTDSQCRLEAFTSFEEQVGTASAQDKDNITEDIKASTERTTLGHECITGEAYEAGEA